MAITETGSTYWINGRRIATCDANFPPWVYVGLYAYHTAPYRARGFDVTRDPRVLAALQSERPGLPFASWLQ